MNSQNYFFRLLFFSNFFITILFAYRPNTIFPENNQNRDLTNPDFSVVNINNMVYWIHKDGGGTTAGSPNGVQADYPISTGGLIYEDGVLWGVKSSEYQGSQPVRVGGSTYYKGMKAGYVVHDAGGNVLGADDPGNHHVWRVRIDWATTDLTEDAANFYAISIDEVDASQLQNIVDQYEHDWINWPAALGAPYEDDDGDGTYDPSVDVPGYPGAYQTVWTISNDVPTIVDTSGNPAGWEWNTAPDLYGSDPVGVELRMTMWAYDMDPEKPLGNTVFKRAQLTYTGLETSSSIINPTLLETVYFTQWSDPDLGNYTDDFVGCDIDLSLGFVYNGNNTDEVFNDIYNMPVPSGGYDFLKSPVDQGGTELGMTAFTYFGSNSNIYDPDLSTYGGSLQFFNLMEGYLPRPEYPDQVPWTDPTTGETTKFVLSGDPYTGEGWIDGVQIPPGDRRLVMASGPFAMSKGESQEIVVALIGAQGPNRFEALRQLKIDDELVQIAYSTNFNLLDYSVEVLPSVNQNMFNAEISVEVSALVASVDATLDNESGEVINFTLNPGNNFLSETELSEGINPYNLSLVVTLSNGESYTLEQLNQRLIVWDPIAISGYHVLYDNLSDDGELNIGDLAQVSLMIENRSNYGIDSLIATIYDVTGPVDYFENPYLSFGDIGPADSSSSSNISGENGYLDIKVADTATEGDTIKFWIRLFDSAGNIWDDEYELYLSGNESISEFVELEHVTGSADGNLSYRIVRPQDVTGHQYEISFSVYNPGSSARSAARVMDCSGSNITGVALSSNTGDGSINLELFFDLVCPGGSWVDGIQMAFPEGFASTVNSHAITGGGNVCSYGLDSGQNCDNLGGTWSGDVLTFGNDARSGFGAFESSNVFTVNYTPAGDFIPVTIGYVIYDDGYDANIVDALGEYTVDELWEYSEGTVLMNIVDTNTGELVLSTDTYPNAAGTNIDIVDGFKLFKGTVLYGAAEDFNEIIYEFYDPYYDISYYDIDSYAQNGWAYTARATDTWGAGITSATILGRDIQVRFTGEFEPTPTTTASGIVYYPSLAEGGSYAWIDGSRLSDLADHPDPNNPGTGDPFRIKIPFEVWDMEAEGGPQQIDITIYDRKQSYYSGDTVYAFNPYDRMYTHFIHLPYQEDGQYGTASGNVWGAEENGFSTIENNLTWNVVWWNTEFTSGDILTFNYQTPISVEDSYVFTPTSEYSSHSNEILPDVYGLAQNYPNPFNPTTQIKYSTPVNGIVQLMIFDILGREIRRLVNTKVQAGNHKIYWNGKNKFGKDAGAGMYFYQLKAGGFTQTKKMVLLK